MPKAGTTGTSWGTVVGLVAWALALLAIGSALAPLSRSFLKTFHTVLTAFAILEAGIAAGRARRWAFFFYAAIAVVMNPIRPFTFAVQTWRLIHGATGLWLMADHLAPPE